jgi:hypothetical protein
LTNATCVVALQPPANAAAAIIEERMNERAKPRARGTSLERL